MPRFSQTWEGHRICHRLFGVSVVGATLLPAFVPVGSADHSVHRSWGKGLWMAGM
jgi:hypothetical protein